MTLQQILRDQNLSRYRLCKNCGIPWATLADICSGKTRLERCNAGTLAKLSGALGMSMEELLVLEPEPQQDRPADRHYLETGLPASVQKAIDDYLRGEQEQVLHLDCLSDELYGAINANLWGGAITEEQARYLRAKYLFADDQEETND